MNTYTLITGASSGIGEATARALAKEGRNLILVARRKEKIDALKSDLGRSVDVRTFDVDLTDMSAVDKMFAELSGLSIDAVINNAGRALGRDRVEVSQWNDLKGMLDLNVTAFLKVIHCSVPFLKKTKGHLVNIGSIAGWEVYEGGVTYCATKHFVRAVSQGLRVELVEHEVRVTEIQPGAVETEFSVVRYKGDTEKADTVYEGYDPLRPEDIADAVVYALSRPKHVTVDQMLVMPTAQARIGKIFKK